MGALDSVLSEVGNRFGMNANSSGSLLSALLSFISQQRDGLSGFLDRFNSAGLGGFVSSWLGGDAKPITVDKVESALGQDTIRGIASKANVPFTAAASAIAFMLPKLIGRLAPGGLIPSHLPSDVTSYISGPTATVASGARQTYYAAERATSSVHRWLWPVLGLLLALFLASWLWNRSGSVKNAVFDAAQQVRLATEKASAALASLKPGFGAQELVDALNQGVINFPTASSQIPADSQTYLNQAAAAIKLAPAGTVIGISGHTDNTGDAAANLQLSKQRADAVRDYLIGQGVAPAAVASTGFGDTRPVASNDTEEGKFRNRRIEFSVVR